MHGDNLILTTDNAQDCYGGIAAYYDELYAFRSAQDLQFYLALADRPRMRILELGCGTGRICIPLARAGHAVTALDLSSAMLDRLAAKLEQEDESTRERVTVVNGGMEDFSLDGNFDLILIPFRAFQHLLDTASQRSCLTAVRRHLAGDGRLVFDVFDPNLAKIARFAEDASTFRLDLEIDTANGGQLRRYTRIEADCSGQQHAVTMRFERIDAGGRIVANAEDSFGMRWMMHNEAVLLLELCGLELLQTLSSYDGSPLAERRGELIYTCRRAAGH
jgi:SAM-dependent methyltransferase